MLEYDLMEEDEAVEVVFDLELIPVDLDLRRVAVASGLADEVRLSVALLRQMFLEVRQVFKGVEIDEEIGIC